MILILSAQFECEQHGVITELPLFRLEITLQIECVTDGTTCSHKFGNCLTR